MDFDVADPLLADLNPRQQEAVQHCDGPLLVLAGPGSGKTRVITRRAAFLVRSGISARNILTITFTNKAADELRSRLDALGVARGMWICTFHALGARLLREMPDMVGRSAGFTIYDVADQRECLNAAYEQCNISPRSVAPELAANTISSAKNDLRTPQQMADLAERIEQRAIARLYEAYDRLLQHRNAVDFDDLLVLPVRVLSANPPLAEQLQRRFRYVMIDEYQDTNHAQYVLARLLSDGHGNLCVSGDPDQSIYAWRGADISNILEFERDYPQAKVVRLEQNYRSTSHILRVADGLIAHNSRRKAKTLWTDRSGGEPVQLWRFDGGEDEAHAIVREIHRLISDEGRSPSDIAILYRVNAVSRGLEEQLRLAGLPYRIVRGLAFYERREIRDVLAYLRVIVNPLDRVALERIINVPARGIGKTTLDRLRREADAAPDGSLLNVLRRAESMPSVRTAARKLADFVALMDRLAPLANLPPSDAIQTVLEATGYERLLRSEHVEGGEDRLANVAELITTAVQFEQREDDRSLRRFLEQVALVNDQDAVDASAGSVLLMTLHAAKGLEFPVVFLCAAEQGLLPHERALQAGDIEEERRLCFVGLTRAQDRLYVTHARHRVLRGQRLPRAASTFLRELPPEALIERNESTTQARVFSESGGDDLERWRRTRKPWSPEQDSEPSVTMDDPTLSPGRSPSRHLSDPDRVPPAVREAQVGGAVYELGALVVHPKYGVGQVRRLYPSSRGTMATIAFELVGERTFVLEQAALQRVLPE